MCQWYLPVFDKDRQNFSQVEDVTRCRVVFQWEEKTIVFQFAMKFLLFLICTHTHTHRHKRVCTLKQSVFWQSTVFKTKILSSRFEKFVSNINKLFCFDLIFLLIISNNYTFSSVFVVLHAHYEFIQVIHPTWGGGVRSPISWLRQVRRDHWIKEKTQTWVKNHIQVSF